jgi:hypothetical protein
MGGKFTSYINDKEFVNKFILKYLQFNKEIAQYIGSGKIFL